jgi:hypothetical protein
VPPYDMLHDGPILRAHDVVHKRRRKRRRVGTGKAGNAWSGSRTLPLRPERAKTGRNYRSTQNPCASMPRATLNLLRVF